MTADHISLRTSTLEIYEQKKLQLEKYGSILAENMVNNRPTTVFKLFKPLVASTFSINVLELLAPKAGKVYPDALDHIELVTDEDLGLLINKYPSLNFETKGLAKVGNQDIEVEFADGTSVKFHNQTLENIVTAEKKTHLP